MYYYLKLEACSLQLVACSLQPAACSLQLAACSLQLFELKQPLIFQLVSELQEKVFLVPGKIIFNGETLVIYL
jgi:hypothetical protein